ncbi:MAG TPA: hypothetical protein VER03_09450, partial [Bryobacteraceae bacterium]|nr:hypothetical protein [Bryobacteraceae bacterium]
MSRILRWAVTFLLSTVLVAGAFASIRAGFYGYTLFLAAPVLMGAVCSFLMQPQTAGEAMRYGAVVLGCMTCSLIVFGVEGVFCIAMTLPLPTSLGSFGGYIGYKLMSWGRAPRGGVAVLMLLPAVSVPLDVTARPELYEVRTSVEIAAAPEEVWPHVVSFPELPP